MEHARMLARLGLTQALVMEAETKILEARQQGKPRDEHLEQQLASYKGAYHSMTQEVHRAARVEARRAIRTGQVPHLTFPIDTWERARTLTLEELEGLDQAPLNTENPRTSAIVDGVYDSDLSLVVRQATSNRTTVLVAKARKAEGT